MIYIISFDIYGNLIPIYGKQGEGKQQRINGYCKSKGCFEKVWKFTYFIQSFFMD